MKTAKETILKQDMIIYKLNVRGFTMGSDLPEEIKGTFAGVEQKLDYFKELGVTTIEMMPVYEFEGTDNYWGYTGGDYLSVKKLYLGADATEKFFKQLIRKIHKMNMECILEFWFDRKTKVQDILKVLHYWTKEYKVDGFHVFCRSQIIETIVTDSVLKGQKLFFDYLEEESCEPDYCEVQPFTYNREFLYGIRKFMNEADVPAEVFVGQMRRQQKHQGFVNFVAENNGFCLYDSFAYTEKQNWDNGWENQDGTDYNCSCNCGEEGPSEKEYINKLRVKQIKNALCTLMFAQGVPLIWMGDENCNTQKGNNNPYCQDNEIGWKDWNVSQDGFQVYEFLREIIKIRKEHPILKNSIPYQMEDPNRFGYPDVSYHGAEGWNLDMEGTDKLVGMLYYEKYASEDSRDEFLYVGYNFAGKEQVIALPTLPEGYTWQCILNTGSDHCFAKVDHPTSAKVFCMPSRSVCVLTGRREK